MNITMFEHLPFPYFLINNKYEILSASKSTIEHNSHIKFTSLLDTTCYKNFYSFIFETPDKTTDVFQLYLENEKLTPFRLYKLHDEKETYHIFCHPIDSAKMDPYVPPITTIENQPANTTNSSYTENVSKLAAGIAHEIRNPLTTVKGFIQLLKPYLIEIRKDQYADIAIDEINRANEIIEQFLNATKKQDDRKKKVSINKVLNQMGLLFESEAILHNIDLSIQLSEKDPHIFINENELKQVLINLLKNAIESFSSNSLKRKAEIRVYGEVYNDTVTIGIIDNGCGMKDETIDKLFLPFYTTKSTGTGLGLSISKKIIETYSGQLNVKSKVGKGTTFYIKLPLYECSPV